MGTKCGFLQDAVSFNLGEATTDTTMDGRNIEMTVTQPSPNVWLEVQTGLDGNFGPDPRGKTTRLTRTFLTDRMLVDLTVGSVSSSSIFGRKE